MVELVLRDLHWILLWKTTCDNRGLKYHTIIVPEPMCFFMAFLVLKMRCINICNTSSSWIVFCVHFQWPHLSSLISFHFKSIFIRYSNANGSCLMAFTCFVDWFLTFHSQYMDVFLSYVIYLKTSARKIMSFHRSSYSETFSWWIKASYI